ncbi:metal-dependent hydrolase [bacterium]|nr:metal-dependent hydrolase [bacterium]
MDSITQLVLGCAVAYVVAGKQLGKRSLLIGAIAGTFPDLDSIPLSLFNDDFLMLKYHRGVTHSLLFCLFFPFLLAYLTRLFTQRVSFKVWYWVYFWVFLTHTVLDCFTSWGTQLFWPLAPRVAFNSIFIIDPLYTIWIILAVGVCLFKSVSKRYLTIMKMSLLVSSVYLLLTLGVKWKIYYDFKAYFAYHNIDYSKMMTRPTPFNIVLWSATVKTETGFYVALRSLFDTSQQEQPLFIENPRVDESLFMDKRSHFVRFVTNGFYKASYSNTGLNIHDLRFGSMANLLDSAPQFLFTYRLSRPIDHHHTKVVIQNPVVSDTKLLFKRLWIRLKGV